jgi:hypothetical protein
MVIAKNHTRRLFTLTEEEVGQISRICDQTGETPSRMLRRLVAAEAMLIDRGFVTVPTFHDSPSNSQRRGTYEE